MTEHKHADDGGPYSLPIDKATEVRFAQPIDWHRFELAKTFAAAWLAIVAARNERLGSRVVSDIANDAGLSMADDLIRRLREST